jgi:ABC-type Fe3+-siderophore transport system permease subunit
MRKTLVLITLSQLLFPVSAFAATQTSGDPAALMCFPFMLILPIFYGLIWLMIMAVSLGGFVLWILMLIDLMRRDVKDFPPGQSDPKLIWLLLVLLTSYLGALIYYIMVYRKYGKAK